MATRPARPARRTVNTIAGGIGMASISRGNAGASPRPVLGHDRVRMRRSWKDPILSAENAHARIYYSCCFFGL
jgi:hypothetical protein